MGDQEEYVSWSPDSRYLAFYQSDNSRYAGEYGVLHLCDDSQYTIYNREGNVAYSGAADGFHWCEEPDFFTLSVSVEEEERWKLINLTEGENISCRLSGWSDLAAGTGFRIDPSLCVCKFAREDHICGSPDRGADSHGRDRSGEQST